MSACALGVEEAERRGGSDAGEAFESFVVTSFAMAERQPERDVHCND